MPCAKELGLIGFSGPWAIDSIKAPQIFLMCSHVENYYNCLLTRYSHLFRMITIPGKFLTHWNLVISRMWVIIIIVKICTQLQDARSGSKFGDRASAWCKLIEILEDHNAS